MKDHFSHVESYEKKGMSFIGGNKFPPGQASIFIECGEREAVEDFVKNDPYFKNGIARHYEILGLDRIGNKGLKALTPHYAYRPL